MSENLGIYIHIPFCRSKCPYCDFYSERKSGSDYENYVNLLSDSVSYWGGKINKKVDTVYLGGGTPSVLSADMICRIIESVKSNFNVDKDAEITMEVNPESGKDYNFDKAANSGVNRVSVGLQSSDPNELKKLGRLHNPGDVTKTVESIRKTGIDNISLDLMLAIPEQTKESLKKSIDYCTDLGVNHISSYILKIEEGTFFYDHRDRYKFPDEEAASDLYLYAVDYLESKGYSQYEISNFAKKDYESRHNLKYWNLDEYLGIGPAAHSFIDGKRFYYPSDIKDFKNNNIIDEGNGGTEEEYIMLKLRLTEGIELKKLLEFKGDNYYSELEKYIEAGFMRLDNERIAFSPKGFLVSNTILADILK